ncbi:hypothetical protein Tco_0583936 [Tanacetum coccineum]
MILCISHPVDVPEVYMHQFWDSVYKHDTFYRFKMDKRKRFKLTLEIFRDIFKIYPRVQGQDFDALPTDEEIVSFLRELGHSGEINSLNDVISINPLGYVPSEEFSWRNKIGMHTSKDDYLINTLRFVFGKEESQIYGAQLPKSMTIREMQETKAYKTYLGYATGATPPKKARKFKKPASPQLTIVLVSPEEPTRKSKRIKRPAKKSTKAPTGGVVIKETPDKSSSKKKEKMTVEKRKGIDLLSEVALTEEAQYEEVRKKSLRDFHKTHLSGSGTITKTAPSAAKIKPSGKDEDDNNNEHNSRSEGSDQERDSGDDNTQSDSEKGSDSEHETDENESGSESDQEENEEEIGDDDEEEEDKFLKTPSNDTDNDDETKIKDKAEGDEDEEMYYTTSQLYDDVDIRLNKPVTTEEGFNQKEGADAEMTNIQQGNENPEITLNQVIKDAHVTLSTVL